MKRLLVIILCSLFGLGLFFFWLIPHGVDRFQNAILQNGTGTSLPLHRELRVVDLHADTLLWDRDLLVRGARGHVDLPRLQEGNVALQVFSVVTKSPRGLNTEANSSATDNISILAVAQRWPLGAWKSLLERALYQADKLGRAIQDSEGQLRWIKTRKDLEMLLEDRKQNPGLVGALLALEGAHALEGSLSSLNLLEAAGFRLLAPTHMFDSEISGSQQGQDKGGLSELGRAWVLEMNRRQLIIDLAHASSRTITEVLVLSTRPVVVSHTGLNAVCPSNRNLSDEQIKGIAASGGLIGIGYWDEAICGRDYHAVARSLRHLIEVGGVRVAALGSDWDGFVTTVTDASGLAELTKALVEEKFTEDEIRAVMGENALRFLLEQLPSP
ncbi:MAG: membrane dipeptidase [Bdellovibrionaceae bacterium]|nr:membrane dipeptidase [Pseudobdellovibrionaceae bacterium]